MKIQEPEAYIRSIPESAVSGIEMRDEQVSEEAEIE